MKKFGMVMAVITLVCALILGNIPSVYAASFEGVRLPTTDYADDRTADDNNYPGFLGRLNIPTVGINVALYNNSAQYVCDRWDSACCFRIYPYKGMIIADHSNQEFAALYNVSVGTVGEIIQDDGSVISLRCAEVFNGHNTGEVITDGEYNSVMGTYDYLSYTCMDGWQNVRVCQWEVVSIGISNSLDG